MVECGVRTQVNWPVGKPFPPYWRLLPDDAILAVNVQGQLDKSVDLYFTMA